MYNAVEMDKLFLAGLRQPHSSSSQEQQQYRLAQHLSQSLPQHLQPGENNNSSSNLNRTVTSRSNHYDQSPSMKTLASAFPQPECPVSNQFAYAMISQQQQQNRRLGYEESTASASINDNMDAMEPIPYAYYPRVQQQAKASSLNDDSAGRKMSISASPSTSTTDCCNNATTTAPANDNNALVDDDFMREMGSDEHFFGLCNSDPIGDADFDGDAIFERL